MKLSGVIRITPEKGGVNKVRDSDSSCAQNYDRMGKMTLTIQENKVRSRIALAITGEELIH